MCTPSPWMESSSHCSVQMHSFRQRGDVYHPSQQPWRFKRRWPRSTAPGWFVCCCRAIPALDSSPLTCSDALIDRSPCLNSTFSHHDSAIRGAPEHDFDSFRCVPNADATVTPEVLCFVGGPFGQKEARGTVLRRRTPIGLRVHIRDSVPWSVPPSFAKEPMPSVEAHW